MSETRPDLIPDKPVFVTVFCHGREPLLADPAHKALLLGIMRELKATIPFDMLGYVILDNHFHWLLEPAQPDDVPLLVQSAKLRFNRRYLRPDHALPDFTAWEKRYRERPAGNEGESNRLLDYLHYNPVKHGLVSDPEEYPWSSFRSYRAKGNYPKGWGVDTPPVGLEEMFRE